MEFGEFTKMVNNRIGKMVSSTRKEKERLEER